MLTNLTTAELRELIRACHDANGALVDPHLFGAATAEMERRVREAATMREAVGPRPALIASWKAEVIDGDVFVRINGQAFRLGSSRDAFLFDLTRAITEANAGPKCPTCGDASCNGAREAQS